MQCYIKKNNKKLYNFVYILISYLSLILSYVFLCIYCCLLEFVLYVNRFSAILLIR